MESEESGWPLETVLGLVGVVLAVTVIVRAIGSVMSGLGVPSSQFGLPSSSRLVYGTSWADLLSGLTLLAAVGLITLPRMVWNVPGDGRWSALVPKVVSGVGVIATLTAVAGVVGTVNWIWNTNRISGPAQAMSVADGVAAVAIAVLCAVLCWYAIPYLGMTDPQAERPQNQRPDSGG